MRLPLARFPISGPTLHERFATTPRRQRFGAVNMRTCILILAFLLAGAFLFLFALLCTTAFLVQSRCGARLEYYGCALQH